MARDKRGQKIQSPVPPKSLGDMPSLENSVSIQDWLSSHEQWKASRTRVETREIEDYFDAKEKYQRFRSWRLAALKVMLGSALTVVILSVRWMLQD